MTRLFLWLVLAVAGATLAAWLAANPGDVTLAFVGFEVNTSFAVLATLVLAFTALVGLLVWLIGWLGREMPVFGKNRAFKRQAQGLALMNKALVALSAGDHRLARRLTIQAEALLPPQPMLHLIAAEAALKAGDQGDAIKRFEALESSEEGRLIGLRGLVVAAREQGREAEALKLARIAFQENRKSPWVLNTLFALEIAAGNWVEAGAALDRVARENLIATDDLQRHRAALAFAEAIEAGVRGDRDLARKRYEMVLKSRPHFPPAVVALSQLDLQTGHKSKANKRILSAWREVPHPALARAYKGLDIAESGSDWLKRVETLVSRNAQARASDLVLADAFLDARLPDKAAPVIDRLAKNDPDRAVWRLKLRCASQRGEDTDAIEDALETAREPITWSCSSCGRPSYHWSPLCEHCGAFDTLENGDVTEGNGHVSGSGLMNATRTGPQIALIPPDKMSA